MGPLMSTMLAILHSYFSYFYTFLCNIWKRTIPWKHKPAQHVKQHGIRKFFLCQPTSPISSMPARGQQWDSVRILKQPVWSLSQICQQFADQGLPEPKVMSLCLMAFNQFSSHWCKWALKPSKHLASITIGLLLLFYVYSEKRVVNSEGFFCWDEFCFLKVSIMQWEVKKHSHIN